VSILWNK